MHLLRITGSVFFHQLAHIEIAVATILLFNIVLYTRHSFIRSHKTQSINLIVFIVDIAFFISISSLIYNNKTGNLIFQRSNSLFDPAIMNCCHYFIPYLGITGYIYRFGIFTIPVKTQSLLSSPNRSIKPNRH